MNTTIHTKITNRGLINDAAKIGLKLMGNLAKEVIPKNYIINSANNRYLNRHTINLHKIERVYPNESEVKRQKIVKYRDIFIKNLENCASW